MKNAEIYNIDPTSRKLENQGVADEWLKAAGELLKRLLKNGPMQM